MEQEENKYVTDEETFVHLVDGFIDSEQMLNILLSVKEEEYTTNINRPWPEQLIPDGVGEVRVWELGDEKYQSIRSYLVSRMCLSFPRMLEEAYDLNMQVTEWQPGAYIPFHQDDHVDFAATCYLENDSEGGYFLFRNLESPTQGTFIDPIQNRMVYIKNTAHAVTPVISGKRTTLQVWAKSIDRMKKLGLE